MNYQLQLPTMNSEEKFKELLREKLNEKEFSFNEKHWGSMRDMIDESRDKKGKRVMLFLLFVACMTGTLFLYLFTDNGNETTTLARVEKNKNETSLTQNQHVRLTDKEPDLTKKQQTRTKEFTSSPGQNFQQPSQKPEQIKSEMNHFSQNNRDGEETGHADQKDALIPNNTSNVQPVKQQTVIKIPTALPVTSTSVPITEEVKMELALNQPIIDDTRNTESKIETTVPETEKIIATENAANETPTEPVVSSESASLVNTPVILTDSVAINSPVVADVILPIAPNEPKHTVSFEAGANYLAGWKEKDKRDARGFNFIAGVNYQNTINHQLSLSAGLQYTSVRNLSAYSHSSTATSYGFGEKKDVTVITPEKIHYVQVPVKFHVALNANNTIGFGYTLGYLTTVNSKVETYGNGTNYSTETSFTKTNGYIQGFNKFDSQLSVFYKRMVLKDFFINTEMIYGLTDTKQNNFVKTSVFERNMGLRITIGYNIFQK